MISNRSALQTCLTALVLLSSLAAAGEREALLSKAKTRAAAESKDLLVLYHGSDWCPRGKKLKALWDTSTFANSIKEAILVAEVDAKIIEAANAQSDGKTPGGLDAELAKKQAEELRKNFRPSNYPAIVYYDKTGRRVAALQGMDCASRSALTKMLRAIQTQRKTRDALWAQADKAKSAAKARLIGKGLDTVNAPRPIRRPRGRTVPANNIYHQLEAMRAADPTDSTGYVRRYSFDPGVVLSEAAKAHPTDLNKRLNRVDAELTHRHNRLLQVDQLQALCIAAYAMARSSKTPAVVDHAYGLLARAHKLAPDTNNGIGCGGILLMDRGPASLRYGFAARHLKKDAPVEWAIGSKPNLESLAPRLTKPGEYRLEVHLGSRSRNSITLSKVTLRAGGKAIASDSKLVTLTRTAPIATFSFRISRIPSELPLTITLNAKASGGVSASGAIRLIPPGK